MHENVWSLLQYSLLASVASLVCLVLQKEFSTVAGGEVISQRLRYVYKLLNWKLTDNILSVISRTDM